eukprot:COSAG01_NODE_59497_length_300_cov_0.517413_1_plen_24_part_10
MLSVTNPRITHCLYYYVRARGLPF